MTIDSGGRTGSISAYRREFWVDSGGVMLRCLDWGGANSKKLVVMMHGVGQTAMTFNTLGPRLCSFLGDEYRFISFDDRGAGDSEKPLEGYGVSDIVADLDAVVADTCASEVVVVGHSRGGWYAALYAALRPDLVSRLVLIDPARLWYGCGDAFGHEYARRYESLGPFASMDAAVASAISSSKGALWSGERREAVVDCYRERFDGSVVGKMPPRVLEKLAGLRSVDHLTPLAGGIRAGALMFVSARSGAERRAQKLAYREIVPSLKVELLDGGHYLQYDCIDSMVYSIRSHLRRLS